MKTVLVTGGAGVYRLALCGDDDEEVSGLAVCYR